MINNEEINISNRSYINKDFQSIYPELVELVKKFTNRWSPETTNESDPMLVLLKLLGFMGDKLNYNIDKNVLEAFLPSATQETSVRQLLETNGYTKKYYQSASTYISLLYQGELTTDKSIKFNAFETQFTDDNSSITYTLLQDIIMTSGNVTYGGLDGGLITEGTPKDLTINGNTSIQLSNLDDNYRLYFPETMVAQNRIYVKNVESNDWNTSGNSGDGWSQVDNLNLYTPKSKNFKFGFDSNKNLPYIQFPDDIVELIGNGLNVKYIITSGIKGNISRGRLTILGNPSEDSLYYYNGSEFTDENVILNDSINNQKLLRIFNYYASTNGANPESINDAYNNFKKTIGTFDTLVTPRDFANWLYSYINPETSYPLISNIQVSDRRIDTTFYQPILTYNEFGVTTEYNTITNSDRKSITPFDLVLYPLKRVNTYTTYDQNGNLRADNYDATFKPASLNNVDLITLLQDVQSIDHTYLRVANNEPYLYKNKYTLNIKVSTIDKVNEVERRTIINNIKQALFDNFNSRELDYGYEIPMDTLYDVVLNSDTRIKNVLLDDPIINTYVMFGSGEDKKLIDINENNYVNMVARNVLAGKVNLYEYYDNFNFDYTMGDVTPINNVTSMTPIFTLSRGTTNYTLGENQVVQVFGNSYSTSQTATVGVNYYWYSETTIDENKVHKILDGEALYISYTNSDNVLRTYKYTKGEIITYNEQGKLIGTEQVENNIIEPTFTLRPTTNNGTIRVNSDMPDNPNFNQLGANQEIKFKKKNQKVFNKGVFNFYWKRNNSKNELFLNGENEIILGEDEYLMYTDTTKSSVEIFSTGTKINKSKTGFIDQDWTCTSIDTSELIDGDLSTYAGIDWKLLTFNTDNTLTISKQSILTMTQGDKIVELSADADIDNILRPFNSFKYELLDGTGDKFEDNDNLYDYKIRTRLDILSGPDLPQTLVAGEKIIINDDVDNTLINKTFRTNYLIQRSGNGTIDTNLEGMNFNLITYEEEDDPSVEYSGEVIKQGNQYKIEFKSLAYTGNIATIKINVPYVSGKKTKFMVYFFQKNNGETVSVNNVDAQALTNGLLTNGVNMLTTNDKVTSVTFTITSSLKSISESYIVIDEVKVISGINSIFNLNNEQTLYDEIDALSGSTIKFYSTYTIPYAKLIDIDDFKKPEVLWDKNNVVNKFTLAQIDFGTSKIDVLKSSLK